MSIVIPTTQSGSSFVETVTIDSILYRLLFNWNTRDENWYLTISDKNDNPLVTAIKLVVNYELIRDWPDMGLPTGYLIAVDMSETGDPCGRNDLGNRVILMYFSESEIQ